MDAATGNLILRPSTAPVYCCELDPSVVVGTSLHAAAIASIQPKLSMLEARATHLADKAREQVEGGGGRGGGLESR